MMVRLMGMLKDAGLFICVSVALSVGSGCSKPTSTSGTFQGYVEGEYVCISAPLSGRMEKLFVQRGDRVKSGDPLFELENVPEKTARDEAQMRLAQARAFVADAKKGKRPTEVESMSAQLKQARAALHFSENELARQEKLLNDRIVSLQEVEKIRTVRDQDRQRVVQLEADLATARLASRSDQITAAEAGMRAQGATAQRSEWELSQKRQGAPAAGLVFDTLYRAGEWVAAGRPAVVLLPPGNVKVRTFVAQPDLTKVRAGDGVKVTVDGRSDAVNGKVTFISPRAEYTPPVIYSRENRRKLMYMVEIGFEQTAAQQLHPGQPVDVRFGP